MEVLGVHMKKVHLESDHNRIDRLFNTFEPMQIKGSGNFSSFDCTECGILFSSIEDQRSHNEKQHKVKCSIVKSEEILVDSGSDSEQEDYDDLAYYDIEFTPKEPSQEEKTGVSFKGDSEEFESAHKVLENMMNKARTSYDVEGNKVLVKSVPKASRITIEITTVNGEKGCVGLQFHNPKKGKKSFRLTKPKREESKFLIALAEKVFKPLLKGLITGDLNESSLKKLEKRTLNKTIKSLRLKKNTYMKKKLLDCVECGKCFNSSLSFKTHKIRHEIECQQCDFTNNSKLVVEEHIQMNHKVCLANTKPPVKKADVVENCGNCNLTFTKENNTDRATEVVKKHQTECIEQYQCAQCSSRSNSKNAMVDHMESEHALADSPEYKRIKVDITEEALNKMKSLSVSEEELSKIESNKQDEKILRKRMKEDSEEINCEMDLDIDKKRKRESSKKTKKAVLSQKPENNDPNLRELPASVKPLVEEGSQEYLVKGDGPCFLRTTAAHVVGDQREGPQLARDLNTHQAEYRTIYEEKVSADFPLSITIGVQGQEKTFENSNDYFNWLQESHEAAFMWRGCVDVIAMCNMANMDIDMIIHEEGKTPEKQLFRPDHKFPWREDDPMKPPNWPVMTQGKITVLNWKNMHFNLIVGPQHMLAQYGSLTFQTLREAENRDEAAKTQGDFSLPPLQVLEKVPEDGDDKGEGYAASATVGQKPDARAGRAQGEVTSTDKHQDPKARVSKDQVLEDIRPARELGPEGSAIGQEVHPQGQATADIHTNCKLKLAEKEDEIRRLNNVIKTIKIRSQKSNEEYDNEDIEELDSEAALVSTFARRKGFVRSNPQGPATSNLSCIKCDFSTKFERELKIHMEGKHINGFICTVCQLKFTTKINLNNHQSNTHKTEAELNCNDCEFQANTGLELKKTPEYKTAQSCNWS